MDLKTIKLHEDLRVQVEREEQAWTKKLSDGSDALVRQALNDFETHFSNHDFICSTTDNGATARYQKAAFELTIERPIQASDRTFIILTPPDPDRPLRAEVVMFGPARSRSGSLLPHGGDAIKQFEDDLLFFHRALNGNPPRFSLHVVDDGGRNILAKAYKSCADLLMAVYPE